jgi:hypothetical protein
MTSQQKVFFIGTKKFINMPSTVRVLNQLTVGQSRQSLKSTQNSAHQKVQTKVTYNT